MKHLTGPLWIIVMHKVCLFSFLSFSLPSPLYKHCLSALYQIPKMNQVDLKNVLSGVPGYKHLPTEICTLEQSFETILTQKINMLFYIWNSVSRIAIRGLRWPLNCTEILIKKRQKYIFPLQITDTFCQAAGCRAGEDFARGQKNMWL